MSLQGCHITIDTVQYKQRQDAHEGCHLRENYRRRIECKDKDHTTATLLYPRVLEIQCQVHSVKNVLKI